MARPNTRSKSEPRNQSNFPTRCWVEARFSRWLTTFLALFLTTFLARFFSSGPQPLSAHCYPQRILGSARSRTPPGGTIRRYQEDCGACSKRVLALRDSARSAIGECVRSSGVRSRGGACGMNREKIYFEGGDAYPSTSYS